MKKTIAILLSIALTAGFTACKKPFDPLKDKAYQLVKTDLLRLVEELGENGERVTLVTFDDPKGLNSDVTLDSTFTRLENDSAFRRAAIAYIGLDQRSQTGEWAAADSGKLDEFAKSRQLYDSIQAHTSTLAAIRQSFTPRHTGWEMEYSYGLLHESSGDTAILIDLFYFDKPVERITAVQRNGSTPAVEGESTEESLIRSLARGWQANGKK